MYICTRILPHMPFYAILTRPWITAMKRDVYTSLRVSPHYFRKKHFRAGLIFFQQSERSVPQPPQHSWYSSVLLSSFFPLAILHNQVGKPSHNHIHIFFFRSWKSARNNPFSSITMSTLNLSMWKKKHKLTAHRLSSILWIFLPNPCPSYPQFSP